MSGRGQVGPHPDEGEARWIAMSMRAIVRSAVFGVPSTSKTAASRLREILVISGEKCTLVELVQELVGALSYVISD
jgi:hypothetical protein